MKPIYVSENHQNPFKAQIVNEHFAFSPSISTLTFPSTTQNLRYCSFLSQVTEFKEEMLRSILRAAAATSSKTYQWQLRTTAIPAATYSTKPKKDKSKADAKKLTGDASVNPHDALSDEQVRARFLAADEKDPSLDVGPNGRALFTSTPSLSQLTRKDTCSYFKFTYEILSLSFFYFFGGVFTITVCAYFNHYPYLRVSCELLRFRMKDLNAVLPEGLPTGMLKEFEDSMRTALLVRQSFLDLRDNFRRVVDPPMWSSNAKGVFLVLLFRECRNLTCLYIFPWPTRDAGCYCITNVYWR